MVIQAIVCLLGTIWEKESFFSSHHRARHVCLIYSRFFLSFSFEGRRNGLDTLATVSAGEGGILEKGGKTKPHFIPAIHSLLLRGVWGFAGPRSACSGTGARHKSPHSVRSARFLFFFSLSVHDHGPTDVRGRCLERRSLRHTVCHAVAYPSQSVFIP